MIIPGTRTVRRPQSGPKASTPPVSCLSPLASRLWPLASCLSPLASRLAPRARLRRARKALSLSKGFTLIELLTVIGIIAMFSGFVALALRGGDKSQARDASVATLSSLISSARGHAALKGTRAAVLINVDQSNPDRFQRYVVVCTENTTTGLWEPVDSGVTLPVGLYFLSIANPLATAGPGLHKQTGVDWSRDDATGTVPSELRSGVLQLTVTQAINSAVSEAWRGFAFTPRGTTGNSGAVIIANGRPLSGGPPASVLLENPENVGGLKVSGYGTVTIIRQRQEF